MVRRPACLLCALILLLCWPAGAEARWKTDTPAQRLLKAYVERADEYLLEHGEQPVNSLFEEYRSLAAFGITMQDDAETPDSVEITVKLLADIPGSMELRVSDGGRFPRIAGAFLRALDAAMTAQQSMRAANEVAARAVRNPTDSYEEPVEELNGTSPRVYYAYYPDQYHDGVNWLQMTVIFPLAEYWDETGILSSPKETKAPDTYSGNSEDYEGYFSEDDYTHLEVFATPTPEPDSPAAELDPYDYFGGNSP